jgi:hypothetical protein
LKINGAFFYIWSLSAIQIIFIVPVVCSGKVISWSVLPPQGLYERIGTDVAHRPARWRKVLSSVS